MKKVLITLVAAISAITLSAEANVGFWTDAPKGNSSKSIKGVSFGLPISKIKNSKGAQISIFSSITTNDAEGFQGAIGMTKADEFEKGCQLAAVNFANEVDKAAQVGAYNQSEKGGIQVGFVNNCKNNAKIQVGLVNINKNGLFPVMIFVNFAKDLFK